MRRISSYAQGQVKRRLTQQRVHDMALEVLSEHIELKSHGEQSSPQKVWEIVLSAAAHASSIEDECDNNLDAPSANTVRGVLHESLELCQAEEDLNRVLTGHLAPRYWKRRQKVAVDLHEQPYHGVARDDENEVRRGKAKSGTTHFHTYATAYVVRNGRRMTLALHFVRADESATEILEVLKGKLDALDIRVKLWLCDRGFCQVEALRWLQKQPRAYVPLIVRGKKDPPSQGRVLLGLRHSQWAKYTMSSNSSGQLEFDVAVVRRRRERRRTDGKLLGPRTLLYCVVGQELAPGLGSLSPDSVADVYQGRFGIESSYRQLRQGRFKTTSRSPEFRLLSVGIALLLRNLWVLCCWISTAHSGPGRRSLQSQLRLSTILRWIGRVAEQRLSYRSEIVLEAPSTLRL